MPGAESSLTIARRWPLESFRPKTAPGGRNESSLAQQASSTRNAQVVSRPGV